MTKIAVIDYGMGNLHSVSKALEEVSTTEEIIVTSDLETIRRADKIVLPGVGAIKDCLDAFSDDLRSVTLDLIRNKPTLAICIGMQMLLESSEENGGVKCLNILDGRIVKIPASKEIKVPHMGWNKINYLSDHFLWSNIPNRSFFYFVHSYVFVPDNPNHIIANTEYSVPVVAAVRNKHIWGTQFHPEKSSVYKLIILVVFDLLFIEVNFMSMRVFGLDYADGV